MQGRKDGSKVGAACGARSPHPVCGQPRGESEGQALNLGPSPPRAAWTEARNEGDGKAATASRYSPPPATTSTAAEGGGGQNGAARAGEEPVPPQRPPRKWRRGRRHLPGRGEEPG